MECINEVAQIIVNGKSHFLSLQISQLELEKKQKVLSLKESEQRYKEAKLENKAAMEALECSLQRCKKLENETEQHQQQLNQSLEMSQQVVTAAKARTEEAVLEAVQLQDEVCVYMHLPWCHMH